MRGPGGFWYAVSLAWVAYFGVLQWSVVRFRVPIVLTLTACALGLAWWQLRRPGPGAPARGPVTLALAGSAVVTVAVPLFSYLPSGWQGVARGLLAMACLLTVAAMWRPTSRLLPAVVSGTAYLLAATVAVVTDPAPRIDVWVTLQQASDAIARGENFYAMAWTGSPGVQDAFTYLPWTAVLVAPGRWLAGDVRWALLAWGLLAMLGLLVLGRGRRPAVAAAALLVLAPGTLTQLDQAWTEPLLLAGLVWWAVLVDRGGTRTAWWAVLPLALACASKQHLAMLLPVLLLWRPFGPRRAVATGALAGALMLPWFVASPADFVHDTVTLLVGFHPIRFANTWYLLALNVYGVALPFWLTGLVVLGALGGVCLVVHRRQPGMAELLRWLALLLLLANLVNKQAFYNQFWLSGALVAASFAASAARPGPGRSATVGRGGWRIARSATTSAPAGTGSSSPGPAASG